MSLASLLAKLTAKQDLTPEETEAVFDLIFAGDVPDEDLAAFLLGLRTKGEGPGEILGAARSMRARMITVDAPPGTIDIVGTGGDGLGFQNISTATALVVAACGVPVAKHGNRASTSLSGSSDVLSALGVEIHQDPARLSEGLERLGIAFLFAPQHHPAMRHVAAVRRRLGVRTIFNLLGPLTNPAQVKHHVIGVADGTWLTPLVEVLRNLGSARAWVVHGQDGLDEITTTAATEGVELNGGMLRSFSFQPEDVGLPRALPEALQGGTPDENAKALVRLLEGEVGPYRDIVAVNAAAALYVAERAPNLRAGLGLATEALVRGAARAKLAALVDFTNENR